MACASRLRAICVRPCSTLIADFNPYPPSLFCGMETRAILETPPVIFFWSPVSFRCIFILWAVSRLILAHEAAPRDETLFNGRPSGIRGLKPEISCFWAAPPQPPFFCPELLHFCQVVVYSAKP